MSSHVSVIYYEFTSNKMLFLVIEQKKLNLHGGFLSIATTIMTPNRIELSYFLIELFSIRYRL